MILRAAKRIWVRAGITAAVLIALIIWHESLYSDGDPPPWAKPLVERDLDVIATDTLRVLVLRDPLSWEERPQATTGLEYELLERFARSLKLPLLAIPVTHPDSMLMDLQAGRGDVIAAQCTDRKDQREWFAYTTGYTMVRPMLARLRTALHAVLGGYIPALRESISIENYLRAPALGTRSGISGALLLAAELARADSG